MRSDRQRRFDVLVLSTLPKAAIALAVVYTAMTIVDVFVPERPSPFAFEDAALALTGVALAVLARKRKIPARAANPILATILVVGGLRILHEAYALGVAPPLVPLLLVMLAMGAMILSWPIFLAAVSSLMVGILATPGTTSDAGLMLSLVGTCGVAAVLHLARARMAATLLDLHAAEELRARSLAQAQAMAKLVRWDWDVASDEVQMPPDARELYGIPPGSGRLARARLIDAVHLEDRARVEAELKDALAGDARAFEFRHRILHPDGVLHVAGRGEIMRDANGSPTAVWGITQDVTEATRMGESLRRSERLSSLGTLVAGVAHEINNPLAYMLGSAELTALDIEDLLADPGTPAAMRERLAEIRDRQQTLVKGVGELSQLSRSLRQVARDTASTREPVAIVPLARDVLRVAGPRIPAGVDVALQVDAEPTVIADRSELTQVLLNLVFNAADAMRHAGRGSLLVHIGEHAGEARIHVRDTGVGIATDTRAKLFAPFFTTKAEGTGLGLSISHSIIESHGGRISFESELGQGAEFVVALPVLARPLAAKA